MLKEIKYLLQKELLAETRQKYGIGAVLLYVLATVFVCQLSFAAGLSTETWNALFWIIMLFSAFNAVAKSFIQEQKEQLFYTYTLASPHSIILAKIIYNAIVMGTLALLGLFTYSLFLGSEPLSAAQLDVFFIALVAGAVGLAITITFMSAIAAQSQGGIGLVSILGLPIVLPLLTATLRCTENAINGIGWDENMKYIIVLLALDLIVIALSFVLFPYLWRD